MLEDGGVVVGGKHAVEDAVYVCPAAAAHDAGVVAVVHGAQTDLNRHHAALRSAGCINIKYTHTSLLR